MRLKPEQLDAHLKKGLQPVYLIAGDEPLQAQEAADAIRQAARAWGAVERQVFTADKDFEWSALDAAAASLSLFAERRLLELRLPGKPGAEGTKALEAYAARPPEDTLLLVQTGKLDKGEANARWVKALEAAGAMIQVWPLSPAETPGWIERRMRSRGLVPTPEAVQVLAGLVEGNLLAAAQEIDKLKLLSPDGRIDEAAVLAAAADSARYDVFDLVDAALAGDAARVVRILDGLRAEGESPVPLVAMLAREVRGVASAAEAIADGVSQQQALQSVWQKRQPLVRAALGRYRKVAAWHRLLQRCAQADCIAKGQAPGNPWDELLQLTLAIAGKPLFRPR
ncbi:MAG: DNA polymerase III subunit delta [Chromatiales bacterium]|nr:DNA polymerase III subunit delta [Chromatiales bacterium]